MRHHWPASPKEAVALQRKLASRVSLRRYAGPMVTVAGVDVSFTRGDERVFGGVVVLRYPELVVVDEAWAVDTDAFPYIPGLLSFRELPVVLAAIERLTKRPDVIICDGQGIAHPRRLGIASHLGLWLECPTIGCAKSRLVGEAEEPGAERGSATPLILDGRRVGYLLRTRSNVKPVYVSPGHLISAAQARDVVLACARGFRLPETTRYAHNLVNRIRREALAAGKP